MANTQQRFLTAVEVAVTEQGLELVVDRQWANTGTIYASMPGQLDPVGDVLRYDFQDRYFTMKVPEQRVAVASYGLRAGDTIADALQATVHALTSVTAELDQ